MNSLKTELEACLREQAALIYPEPLAAAEAAAAQRLTNLAVASPSIICFLAEPWIRKLEARQDHWRILSHCARLHLYSRILDDAIDENNAWQQRALLRAQVLFWDAVFQLGSMAPAMGAASARLVRETTDAVIANDLEASAAYWGAKNHHLLLIPLFLSGDEEFFTQSKPALTASLALLQARDELEQGSCRQKEVYCQLITDAMRDDIAAYLAAHGWLHLSRRLCLESRRILLALKTSIF